MGYQLDTSGAVIPLAGQPIGGTTAARFWSDLSPFTQGYIEALFQSPLLQRDEDMPITLGFSDLAPETLARIIADCEAAEAWQATDTYQSTGLEFWMVRQAGRLATFPPLTVQLGDDGKVRFAEPRPSQQSSGGK